MRVERNSVRFIRIGAELVSSYDRATLLQPKKPIDNRILHGDGLHAPCGTITCDSLSAMKNDVSYATEDVCHFRVPNLKSKLNPFAVLLGFAFAVAADPAGAANLLANPSFDNA